MHILKKYWHALTNQKQKMTCPLNPLTTKQAERFIKSYSYWYQRIDIGNGKFTMEIGPAFHEMVWEKFKPIFPNKLNGASVLDIGTNAGYFPIEFKKIGAGYTVGLEFIDEFIDQARKIKKIYGLTNIDYFKMDAHEVYKLKGKFDIVIFTGILYHLKNPLQVIEEVAKKCNDVILIETEAIPLNKSSIAWARDGFPPKLVKHKVGLMKFIEGDKLNKDPTNWWIPDTECVKGMLRTGGFKYFSEPYFIDKTRLMIAATKEKKSLVNLKKVGE